MKKNIILLVAGGIFRAGDFLFYCEYYSVTYGF